jgi:hypothetical protein
MLIKSCFLFSSLILCLLFCKLIFKKLTTLLNSEFTRSIKQSDRQNKLKWVTIELSFPSKQQQTRFSSNKNGNRTPDIVIFKLNGKFL